MDLAGIADMAEKFILNGDYNAAAAEADSNALTESSNQLVKPLLLSFYVRRGSKASRRYAVCTLNEAS